MENKLELKDVCGYLPYGLKVQRTDTKTICIIHIDKLSCFDDESNIMVYLKRGMPDKPILRPMSDLTKEITDNGKTFVPIIELAKANYLIAPNFNNDYELLNGDNGYQCSFIYSPYKDRKRRFVFQVYKNGDIQCFSCDPKSYSEKSNTAKHCAVLTNKLSDLLHSWHFDIRGLINKGLAIDVNTLNEKVYG